MSYFLIVSDLFIHCLVGNSENWGHWIVDYSVQASHGWRVWEGKSVYEIVHCCVGRMKIPKAWRLGILDMQIMPAPRQRPSSRRPLWIIVLVSLVCMMLIGTYVYPPRRYASCYMFDSSVCAPFKQWLPPAPARLLTDEELASRVVFKDILKTPLPQSKNPKIAFMFLTPGTLPFERLWEKFLTVRLRCYFEFLVDFFSTCHFYQFLHWYESVCVCFPMLWASDP